MTTHVTVTRLTSATLITVAMTAAAVLATGSSAGAAMVPTVPLGTSANYAVLGASTVTNTGETILDNSLGVWPGTAITGFPPGWCWCPRPESGRRTPDCGQRPEVG